MRRLQALQIICINLSCSSLDSSLRCTFLSILYDGDLVGSFESMLTRTGILWPRQARTCVLQYSQNLLSLESCLSFCRRDQVLWK